MARRAYEVAGEEHAAAPDLLAREEPLEIRIGGIPIAVVMRTPGDDEELVRGFLLTEHIVPGIAAIASIRHCTVADPPEADGNVMQVVLAPGTPFDLERTRRNLYASSSCGVCGKASLRAPCARPHAPARARRRVDRPGALLA